MGLTQHPPSLPLGPVTCIAGPATNTGSDWQWSLFIGGGGGGGPNTKGSELI